MDSFEQVAELETPALRELFERGRPEQRVWAIWALALRSGGIVATAGAARDPDAGVRRTIAVMLAGHGEHEQLVVLARRDPSPAVRESAMQLVTRLAAQGAIAPEVVLEAAREDARVRCAILAAIDRGAPAFLVELAGRFLSSGSRDEQADAFEALLRTESPTMCATAIAWLENLPEAQAREACARMLRITGPYPLACELANAPRRLRLIALGVMRDPPWAAVEQLVGDDVALLVSLMREGKVTLPIAALAKLALDGHATPLVERLGADLARIEAPSDELRPLLPLLDAHYAQWIAALDRTDGIDALPADTDDNPADYALARKQAKKDLTKLRKQIRRLMRG